MSEQKSKTVSLTLTAGEFAFLRELLNTPGLGVQRAHWKNAGSLAEKVEEGAKALD